MGTPSDDSEQDTKEVPYEELILSAPTASGALPSDSSEDDEFEATEFAVGPRQPVIGEYALLRRIGSGGNGRVFKARHRQMERLVALKMLSSGTMRDPEAVKRFRREMKAAAKLFHPNIVTAFDAGEHSGVHYLVMEYIDGLSLSAMVERHGPVTIERAVDYVLQAASGLHYAHSHNVVHRDIKPSNLILDEQGVVKILDMGTARFDNDGDLTQTGVIMGTVNYMSPEQARNATDVDPRSDIYSLGCTLHYLLTGEPVFDGNVMQVLMAHAETEPPQLRQRRPETPPWLDDIFQRMVAKRIEDRQATMEALAAELREGRSGAASPDRFRVHAAGGGSASPPLGIDIGAGKTVLATVRQSRVESIRQGTGATAVPSCVRLEGMNISVGRPALERVGDTDHVALGMKRDIGKPLYSRPVDGADYPPEPLLALIVSRLASDAQTELGAPFRDAVLTVPASFDDAQRKAYEEVAVIAGLDQVDLINEPTAAVLATVCSKNFQSPAPMARLLCVDLGESKLDVGIYEFAHGELNTLAIRGTQEVGGRRWDERLADLMADQILANDGADPRAIPQTRAEFIRNCERAKRQIAKHQEAVLAFTTAQGRVQLKVSQQRFMVMASDLNARVVEEVAGALAQAQLAAADLDVILLSGQSTRAPGVLPAIQSVTGQSVMVRQLGVDVAARGAALQADFCRQRKAGRQPSIVVSDVAANSLGLVGIESRSQKRCNAILIPRGTSLPAATRKRFKTFRDGQDSLMIQLLQGEENDADKCTYVGKCVFSELPTNLPAGAQFDVEFQCAANGRVTVFVENQELGYRDTRDLTRPESLSPQQVARWREWVETMTLCSTLG